MNHYHQLTPFERGHIETFNKLRKSLRFTAKELNRSISTISIEINRCAKGTYSAEKADKLYRNNRTNSHKITKFSDSELRIKVIDYIKIKHWSPEQIAGRLSLDGSFSISYNIIYRSIYNDNLGIKLSRGSRGIARRLRHRGKTRHDKNHIETRGKINISNSIHDHQK